MNEQIKVYPYHHNFNTYTRNKPITSHCLEQSLGEVSTTFAVWLVSVLLLWAADSWYVCAADSWYVCGKLILQCRATNHLLMVQIMVRCWFANSECIKPGIISQNDQRASTRLECNFIAELPTFKNHYNWRDWIQNLITVIPHLKKSRNYKVNQDRWK